MSYQTRYHRDGTVTVWDVYRQQWTRREASAVYADDRVMASLPHRDRLRIEAAAAGNTLAESRSICRHLLADADEGGTLQAVQMLDYTRDPTMHITCSIRRAAEHLGCRLMLDDMIQ